MRMLILTAALALAGCANKNTEVIEMLRCQADEKAGRVYIVIGPHAGCSANVVKRQGHLYEIVVDPECQSVTEPPPTVVVEGDHIETVNNCGTK
jgi:hypothetical protein